MASSESPKRAARGRGKSNAGEASKASDPRQQFWQAGESFYNALLEANRASFEALEAKNREYQETYLELQTKVRQRAETLQSEYLSTLHEAEKSASFQAVGAEATKSFHEALAELQTKAQEETQALAESSQRSFTELQTTCNQSRFSAYVDYCKACKKIWTGIDADDLSCENLAFIGHSMMLGAQLVGGRS